MHIGQGISGCSGAAGDPGLVEDRPPVMVARDHASASDDSESESHWKWLTRQSLFTLTLLTITSLILRLAFLGTKNLWLDEIWSLGYARVPWSLLLKIARVQDPNMLLYYTFLHCWVRLGNSEFLVRLLSVLFGVGCVPAIYFCGKQLCGRTTGVL